MKQKSPQHQRLKLAGYILGQLERREAFDLQRISYPLQEMKEVVRQLGQAAARLDYCSQKRWQVPTRCQMEIVAHLAGELAGKASALHQTADTRRLSEVPTLREVVGELDQLHDEFEQVTLDVRNHTISVHSQPITLGDVYLGAFEIRLDLAQLARRRCGRVYRVVALDPHPAASSEDVTHPHVRDEELCEGDAATALGNALDAGRVCDFFLLVRSVLQHYNPGSPYVSLDSWEGVACHDCGYATGESHYCDACGCDYCAECMSFCRQCDQSRCRGCLEYCSACQEQVCSNCRSACTGCGRLTCDGCLEDRLCPDCGEKEEQSHGESENSDSTAVIPIRQRRRNRHRRIAA